MSDFKLIKYRLKLKAQETLQTRQLYIPKVRLQMATSVCVSDLIQIDQMSIKIESSRNIYKRVSYRSQSPTSNGNECLCVRLQIDQMSIKIESSRNITNVSAIDPKVRLQIRLQIDQMSIEIESSRNITNVSAIDPKV